MDHGISRDLMGLVPKGEILLYTIFIFSYVLLFWLPLDCVMPQHLFCVSIFRTQQPASLHPPSSILHLSLTTCSIDRNEIVLHGYTKFSFFIKSYTDYSWCWLHQLIKVGDAVYKIKQQITMIRLDLLIILFTIVLAIKHSFKLDSHMNYIHAFSGNNSVCKIEKDLSFLGIASICLVIKNAVTFGMKWVI